MSNPLPGVNTFEITFTNQQAEDVLAHVTFPNDCYYADGGVAGVPPGEPVPPGYAYIIYYNLRTSNCGVTPVTEN